MDMNHQQLNCPDLPVIGITMGDPAGIGPEIIVKALNDPIIRRAARYVIFGLYEQLGYAADTAEIEPFWGRVPHEKVGRDNPYRVVVADYDEYSVPILFSGPSKIGGQVSIKFCQDAIDAAMGGLVDAVVTAPISKKSWRLAGAKWPGHTELLADRTRAKRKAMMFVTGPLKLTLATVHEALFEIRHRFTIGCVFEAIDLLNDALKEYFGIESPRIGVAGLNPHAGEDGQFGDEEQRIILPAITLAAQQGIQCSGPFSADSLFLMAVKGQFDGVVAMYHDQGLIPVKLLDPAGAVNVTIGIPIIRTSPGHGTGFDMAGRNMADESSMKSAIRTAIHMVRCKRVPQKASV